MTVPMCHKCKEHIIGRAYSGGQLVGCKLDSRIKDYDDAEYLCPLLDEEELETTNSEEKS